MFGRADTENEMQRLMGLRRTALDELMALIQTVGQRVEVVPDADLTVVEDDDQLLPYRAAYQWTEVPSSRGTLFSQRLVKLDKSRHDPPMSLVLFHALAGMSMGAHAHAETEVLFTLSGHSVTYLQRDDGREQPLIMTPLSVYVIPPRVLHRAVAREDSYVLGLLYKDR